MVPRRRRRWAVRAHHDPGRPAVANDDPPLCEEGRGPQRGRGEAGAEAGAGGEEDRESAADLQAALKRNAEARRTFDAFSPSHRREYVEWIVDAKREKHAHVASRPPSSGWLKASRRTGGTRSSGALRRAQGSREDGGRSRVTGVCSPGGAHSSCSSRISGGCRRAATAPPAAHPDPRSSTPPRPHAGRCGAWHRGRVRRSSERGTRSRGRELPRRATPADVGQAPCGTRRGPAARVSAGRAGCRLGSVGSPGSRSP